MKSLKCLLSTFAVLLAAGLVSSGHAQVSVTTGTYSTSFDSLITTGTQTLSAVTGTQVGLNNEPGWYGAKVGGTGVTAMNFIANDGTANSGALYSYGATGSPDRALGALSSGTNIPAFGAWFVNDSGTAFSSITLTFTAEFWRSSTTNQNTLTFAYGFDTAGIGSTNFLTNSSMIAVPELNVVGPAPVSPPNGALNGNDPANQANVSFTITGINWFNGASLFIRWTDVNDAGNDAGLAVDDLTLAASGGSGGADLYWTSGTWNSTSSAGGNGTWQDGQGGWDPSKNANFGGSGGTVTISGTATANAAINFLADGYTIQGGELALGAGGPITVFPSVTATIASVISGTNGLTKAGSGLLILSGSNTFTGTVGLNSGYLQIAEDANLGNSGNALVFGGGGLKVVDNVEIGAGRSVTGSGSLDVASGRTLRFAGAVTAGFTLVNTGTVTLGDISTLTSLNFAEAGAVTTDIGAFLTGNVITTHTAGTARMAGYYSLDGTTRSFTVADGSAGVDLEISATLAGTSYLHKLGLGTLYLSGDTTSEFAGGVRIGSAGTANGGRLLLASGVSLGTSQLQFNWGTLEAETDSTFAVGISIGGRESTRAVFSGANMTFNGDSALFEGNGQQSRVDVNNVTTLNGTLVQNSGTTFIGTGLTVGGTGTLVLNGDGSGQTRTTTITDTATFVVNNAYGAAVNVNAGASLKGTGTIAGLIQVSGIHAVGNSAGIQTVNNGASYLSGSTFEWELVADSNTTPGTDFDQLVVTGGNVSIDSNVTLDLVFNSAGSTVDWTDTFWDTDHSWTIIDITGGGTLTGLMVLNPATEWFDANNILLSAINPDAVFTVTESAGDLILNYYAIPEPTSLALLGLGAVLLMRRRR